MKLSKEYGKIYLSILNVIYPFIFETLNDLIIEILFINKFNSY